MEIVSQKQNHEASVTSKSPRTFEHKNGRINKKATPMESPVRLPNFVIF